MTLLLSTGRSAAVTFAALLAAGCATKDYVLFATKTSLSIVDADTAPPGVSIAYDRTEGVAGPTFQYGHVPSVMAHISSDSAVFQPQIKQAYATGDAARLLVGEKQDRCVPKAGQPLETFPMFFATHTVVGLKIGFSNVATPSPIPSSFVFGFQRQEASAIHLSRVARDQVGGTGCVPNNGEDHVFYPPVLASINLRATAGGTAKESSLENCQFFATGDAARAIAKRGLAALDCNQLSSQAFRGTVGPDTPDIHARKMRLVDCVEKMKDKSKLDAIARKMRLTPSEDSIDGTRNQVIDGIDRLSPLELEGLQKTDELKSCP